MSFTVWLKHLVKDISQIPGMKRLAGNVFVSLLHVFWGIFRGEGGGERERNSLKLSSINCHIGKDTTNERPCHLFTVSPISSRTHIRLLKNRYF